MKNRRYLYPVLFIIHILIALIAFKDFRLDPSGITYSNTGDGMKNHFTLLSYVKEPVSNEGIFKYNVMNYPFGEYVFYTDNTPAFAVAFKWFCLHVYDLSDYTLEIFQTTLILGIILSGLLCFYVFRKLLQNDRFAFVLAVVLPWTNIQVMRIWRGHFNLSYSFLILLAIVLCIKWQEAKEAPRKRWWILVASVCLAYTCFFIHGYYLPIVTGFQAAILLIYGIMNRKIRDGKQSIGAALALPAASLLLVTATLMVTDGFYAQRQGTASGYDMPHNKVHLGSLVTSYDFYHSLSFPVKELTWGFDAENMAFLGNCGLYAALFMLILIIASKAQRERFRSLQREFFRNPLLAAIALAGIMMLSVSIGETYTSTTTGYFSFTNITNPFLYLHRLTKRVEQFRCLGRFVWPFFFSFYLWAAFTLAGMVKTYTAKQQWLILAAFALIGGLEIRDYADKFQAESKKNNLASKYAADFSHLKLDYGRYQAFVPIPFFMVGSETEYVIDDIDSVSLLAYQFHLHSHLPMMACKMSRTVPEQNQLMLTALGHDSLLPPLRNKLSNKPVLVCYERKIAVDSNRWAIPNRDRPMARDYYFKMAAFPQRNRLTAVDSAGDLIFYEWIPKP